MFKIGTPKELGLKKNFYLKEIKKIYNENSQNIFKRLDQNHISSGTLRVLPIIGYFYKFLQFGSDNLQLAIAENSKIIGFYGGPILINPYLLKLYFLYFKKNKEFKFNLEPLLYEDNFFYLTSSLCVDKNFRKMGVAKALKTSQENSLIKKHSKNLDRQKKIIIFVNHESENQASCKTQASMGYFKLYETKYPWPINLNFTLQTKIISLDSYKFLDK